MPEGDLEESFLSAISNAGGKDLIQEAAEFTIDSVLQDGILKEIPVVSFAAKLYSVAVGWQGYLFAKKVKQFLTELQSVPEHTRQEFAKRIADDKTLQDRLVDTLLTILNKLDDSQKAPLLARVFAGYVRDEFDFSTLQRLAVAVDRCFVADLHHLESMSTPKKMDGYVGDVLVAAGLASIADIPGIKANNTQSTYVISHLGELFLQIVINGLPREAD